MCFLFFKYSFIHLFIYLFMAASGLSCGMRALHCSTRGFSLVVARGLQSMRA